MVKEAVTGAVTPQDLENSKDIGKVAERVARLESGQAAMASDLRQINLTLVAMNDNMTSFEKQRSALCTLAHVGQWAIRVVVWMIGTALAFAGVLLAYVELTGRAP